MRLDVDDAFPGKPTLSVGGGSRIELNGHELRVGNLVDKGSGNTVDTVVASDEPATLIATPGSSGIASHTRFEGAASFVKAGGYSMSLKSLSSSTGSVCVTQSTLFFEGGTGWTNASNDTTKEDIDVCETGQSYEEAPFSSYKKVQFPKVYPLWVGGTQVTSIDVRLICATNADLHREVEEGRFREDLLYRINTIEITMPPLRDRGEDIILLAEHFLALYARKYNKVSLSLNRDARQKLLRHTWPGNVRELMHAVERAVLLAKGPGLCAADFVLKETTRRSAQTPTLNLERLEQEAIQRAMDVAGGNISKAADLLGITRYALYRKLNK